MKAIAVAEYRTISSGITAADTMLKAADVDLLLASAMCPGKYIIILTGELSSVKAAVDAAKHTCGAGYINSFVLGNPHESLFSAIYATAQVDELQALGILDTYDVASMLVAADNAAKSANVELIELRLARGLCGKSYMLLTGEVADVSAAIDHAVKFAESEGMLLDSSVIARPDRKLLSSIL